MRWGTDSDMEYLAADVIYRRRSGREPGGIAYARISSGTEARVCKDRARGRILKTLLPRDWPGNLSVLTFPGAWWTFEKMLIGQRRQFDAGLSVTALEKNPAVYAAALKTIPGYQDGFVCTEDNQASAAALSTKLIDRFYCASFEDYAFVADREFDVAWLDFTGPINEAILHAMTAFWRNVRSTLIVTSLKARWNRKTSDRVHRHGLPNLLRQATPGASIADVFEYQDSSPMAQVTLTRSG